ncbi:MAG TPA: DNA-directed RNA polymerase subunit beta, partial [Candidatus Dormibacteraeota bacterium]
MVLNASRPSTRHNYGKITDRLEVGNLIQTQLDSFRWFCTEGLRELFDEINPITDYTGKNYELRFLEYEFGAPKFDEEECRQRDMTFSAPLRINTRLHIKTGENAGEIKEAEVFMGDFAMMTTEGTFIVNGTERVVVSQLVRSPGVYFTAAEDRTSGRLLYSAKLIPNRGAWLEIETSSKDVLTVKIDRKRKVPVTTLVRALGYASNEDIKSFFAEQDIDPEHQYIAATLDKDPTTSVEEALIELYRKIRPGDPPTVENARNLLNSLFFNGRRFDLSKVGRFKLDKNLGIPEDEARERALDRDRRVLDNQDFVSIIRKLISLNNGTGEADDIDHLGNRRVRAVGELLQNQFRMGLIRMERIIKERMTICDSATVTSASLINARPVVAAIKEFFGSSQLSQFMDQTNPLAELTHKRRLSALGPGGLSRERAGFDVRDVHHSHYGRICPIETPEGPNIGLIGSLATFARVNEFGFIETPFRRVYREVSTSDSRVLAGRTAARAYSEGEVKEGQVLSVEAVEKLAKASVGTVSIVPWVSDDIVFLSADEEDKYTVAQANAPVDDSGNFTVAHVACRSRHTFKDLPVVEVDYMDVSPKQTVSVATSLIPFLEHDDANRALMGSNMQKQAVPLLVSEAPIVGTGMEAHAARNSGEVVLARKPGTVVGVSWPEPADSDRSVEKIRSGQDFGIGILVRPDDGGADQWYGIHKFVRSNQGTCLSQRIIVKAGEHVDTGELLADGPSTDHGELALGRNVLVAFMPWEGYNFEDAILISEQVVREDMYTSIHIEEFEVEARDTKLGPEEITRDLPNISEETLRNLNERGIVYVGAEVHPGDILVGKITPKGESELSAEERLLRAIFGEKAREVRDSSLRVPHGERGTVVDVKLFSRESGHELPAGVNELVRVYVAQKRKIAQGDKMAGRHGNKGVIARILPIEDMPYLPDGTPVEIVLNPLGVPSRMNLGQVLETHLGYAAHALGLTVASPVFDGASEELIEDELERAGLPRTGKETLRDGRTGEAFDREVTVGYIYMLKLAHLVEDKIHARSTGPYSLVTQQPLGGKAQFGGQRFGEMEVWALEAYGAA